jgi:glycosyltransferase involved in cell wall biosynthesis
MKIVNIVPGFGGTFYCGNCLRDSGFVHTLKELGHEAHTLPIYLPLFASEDQNEMDSPVFYGAVNIYLKQNYKMFRKMPKWLYRFFDSPAILRFAARKAGSTRASGLEEMTLSMLQGHEGYQKEELDMLVNYLKHHEKPDIVHLSNALLLGLAPKIREETGARVVCSLQDEDVWIDPMEEEWQKKIWKKMSDMGEAVSAFISVSDFFANLMFARMQIPSEKMHVVHIGVDPDHYSIKIPASDPPVIGYISRTNEENGFALLVDAFIHLKENSQFKNAKLKVTGGKTSDDNRFLKKQMNKLRNKGFLEDVEMLDEFKSVVSVDFFEGLTLLSVPVLKGEAFGLYQLEALASGIPIVQPALAAFPEIAETSGGGVVYHPNTPEALAEKWTEVLSNPDKIKKMGAAGRKSVEKVFNIHRLTNEIVEVYRSILPKQGNQRTGI